MYLNPEYYVAKKPDDNGIIKHCIAGFVSKTDAVFFCKLPYTAMWGYVVYNSKSVIVFDPDSELPSEPLQASDTPSS